MCEEGPLAGKNVTSSLIEINCEGETDDEGDRTGLDDVDEAEMPSEAKCMKGKIKSTGGSTARLSPSRKEEPEREGEIEDREENTGNERDDDCE